MSDQNKITRHKIVLCSNCGFTHTNVKPYATVDMRGNNAVMVIKALCPECRKEQLKNETRLVNCAYCGLTKGEKLHPTLIERRVFDGQNTCNFFIQLCDDCKKIPHNIIREKLDKQLQSLCNSCDDRFKCFTAQHTAPMKSYPTRDGVHRNTRSKRFRRIV